MAQLCHRRENGAKFSPLLFLEIVCSTENLPCSEKEMCIPAKTLKPEKCEEKSVTVFIHERTVCLASFPKGD